MDPSWHAILQALAQAKCMAGQVFLQGAPVAQANEMLLDDLTEAERLAPRQWMFACHHGDQVIIAERQCL